MGLFVVDMAMLMDWTGLEGTNASVGNGGHQKPDDSGRRKIGKAK